jgi:Coenzyme PQQ synthesis protein D (PqqD)
MDNIGTRIWVLIEAPKSVGAVCEQLVQEYEVERATCEAGALLLLELLLKTDLISVAPPAQADR